MYRVDEPVPSVPAPVHQWARSPAGFALDAIFEVHHDLDLSGRADAGLVYVRRADVPEPRARHLVLVRQRHRPEDLDVAFLNRVIGQPAEPVVPVPAGGEGGRQIAGAPD